MDVRSTDDVPTEEVVPDVYLNQLTQGDRMSVQHYRFDPGSSVPEHRHDHEQAGFLYRGELTFVLVDGRERVVEAGDGYVVPGGEPHAVDNRGDEPAVGVDIFSPPRDRPNWGAEID